LIKRQHRIRMKSSVIFLTLTILIACMVATSQAVDLNVCKYCKFCKDCKHCVHCPCETSPSKPNCKFCEYCKYCKVCSTLCPSCQKGGWMDTLTSLAEKFGLASATSSLDFAELDESLKTIVRPEGYEATSKKNEKISSAPAPGRNQDEL